MTERSLPEPIRCFRDALGFAMKLHHDEVESRLTHWPDQNNQDLPTQATSTWLRTDAEAALSVSLVSVVLLTASGHCLDVGLLRTGSVEMAASWAVASCREFIREDEEIRNVLLVSVCPTATPTIRESDLDLFRSLRWRLSIAGVDLVDWIETDGDHVRSFAYLTCPAAAWAG